MKGLLHILHYLILILGLFVQSGLAQKTYPVFAWIENDEIEKIESWLGDKDINSGIDQSGTTLLVYSILHGHSTTTSWLIEKGADVNHCVADMSPLMYASGTDERRILAVLIKNGANVESFDNMGNTALFYAAENENLRIVKYLIKRGHANILKKNNLGKTAYDIAVKHNNHEVAKYLRSHYEKNLPDYRDGPYVKWKGKRKVVARYIVHDSKSQITRKEKESFRADTDPYMMKGFAEDTLDYLIHSKKDIPADLVGQSERVMVIGDIHGGYDSLVLFLENNGVINQLLQWTWDSGHLVFMGDIFDRGEKVTEALWLIYQLEHQASKAGGAVHYILGNHEILVLSGNLNYIADKYRLMSDKLNIDYSYLFNKHTLFGQWLRTKNTIIRINGHLFVHAGLSPDILECGLDIHEINSAVRYFLNHPDRTEYKDISRGKLLGHNGPFWYRGYIEENHEYDHLPESEFEKVLEYFNAEYIFVGHTRVKEITPFYNKRVFAVDVPFYSNTSPIQGLLLEGKEVYMLNSSAGKKQIR